MANSFIDNIKLSQKLNIPNDVTFGVEIEFEKAPLDEVEYKLKKSKQNGLIDKKWKLVQDDSLCEAYNFNGYGGEAISPILKNDISAYKEIRNVCHVIKMLNGVATTKCGGHIHIGANILNDDVNSYIRLIKLWTVFENEIIRFSLGETEQKRESMALYAKNVREKLMTIKDFGSIKYDFKKFVEQFGNDKKMGLSFFNLNENRPIKTLEVRCPNGSLNYMIWKNNINFFIKLLQTSADTKKDWNLINRLFNELRDNNYEDDLYNIEKAKLLSRFVFDDEIDQNNFITQYIKDSNKVLVKTK